MTTKRTHQVVLGDGRTEQRVSTSRAYTHAIVCEVTEAEKAAEIRTHELRVAETVAEIADLEPKAATPEAKAAHAEAARLESYWEARIDQAPRWDGGARDEARWLTLSRGLHEVETQAQLDAHYEALRSHMDHMPETDRDGRPLRALVAITPRLKAVKALDDAPKARRLFVCGFNIATGVTERKYGNAVHALASARERLAARQAALVIAREQAVGPESQGVMGWAGSARLAANRVAAEKASRPLARVFALETVAVERTVKHRAKKEKK